MTVTPWRKNDYIKTPLCWWSGVWCLLLWEFSVFFGHRESLVSFRDGFNLPPLCYWVYYLVGICLYSLWLNSAMPLPTQNCCDSQGKLFWIVSSIFSRIISFFPPHSTLCTFPRVTTWPKQGTTLAPVGKIRGLFVPLRKKDQNDSPWAWLPWTQMCLDPKGRENRPDITG